MFEEDTFSAERSLILEVIRRAVFDAAGLSSAQKRARITPYQRQAEAWILSAPDDRLQPFTCAWCCEVLGVDQRKVIRHMRELQKNCIVQGPGKKAQYGGGLKRVMDSGVTCRVY